MANHPGKVPSLPLSGEVMPRGNSIGNKGAFTEEGTKTALVANVSEAKWRLLVGLVADGVSTLVAIKQAKIKKFAIEALLRTDEEAKSQWEDAKTAALWRYWDMETLEDIFVELAMGTTLKKAVGKRSIENPNMSVEKFYRLLLRDPFVKELYDEARTIQAEKMAIDDVLEISDDASHDETVEGRPNSAAVNRSRLKVQSRQWIAGRLNFKRFGDKQHVELDATIIVDHAARLEEARRRKEDLFKKQKKAPG